MLTHSFLFYSHNLHSFSRICPSMLLVMVNGPRHKMAMAINMIKLSSPLVGKFSSPILIVFHPPIPFHFTASFLFYLSTSFVVTYQQHNINLSSTLLIPPWSSPLFPTIYDLDLDGMDMYKAFTLTLISDPSSLTPTHPPTPTPTPFDHLAMIWTEWTCTKR